MTGYASFETVLERAKPGSKNHHLALLSVCRQIYHESKALPLLLSTFQFSCLTTFSESAVVEHCRLGCGSRIYYNFTSVDDQLRQIQANDSTGGAALEALLAKPFWQCEVIMSDSKGVVVQVVEKGASIAPSHGAGLLFPFIAIQTPKHREREFHLKFQKMKSIKDAARC
jgi:hypothetical protein